MERLDSPSRGIHKSSRDFEAAMTTETVPPIQGSFSIASKTPVIIEEPAHSVKILPRDQALDCAADLIIQEPRLKQNIHRTRVLLGPRRRCTVVLRGNPMSVSS